MRISSRWRMSWVVAMGRLGLLLVGILSTPGLLTSIQRSHCAGHEVSATHAVQLGLGHVDHHASTPALSRPAHSDCSHCPASECASLAPCSVSGTSAALPSRVTLSTPSAHYVGAVRITTSPHSTTQ